ncbi:MAG: hypothetical protein HYS77_14230, partial [Candidatus Rokubacteria bacterium]|nr:hypothetical protein [Candidatus Rokubacteria bacterium]
VVEKLKTPLAVITAMWNHAGQMTETTVEENVVWPVLKGGEMADLMAYLFGGARVDGSTPATQVPRPSRARKDAAPAK